jgi:hypothetical protein
MAGRSGVSRALAKAILSAVAGVAISGIGRVASAQTPQLPATVYIWPMANTYTFPFASPPSQSQNVMMASLAGIVNRTTNGEVLLSPDSGNPPNARYWLDQLKLAYPSVQSQVQSNPGFYIDQYKNKLSGYVLFDPASADSINLATSIAGVTDAIVVSSATAGFNGQSTLSLAQSKGLAQIADARTMTYAQAYTQYGNEFNKEMIFHQAPSFDHQLRDYAVMNKGFVYWSDPTNLSPYAAQQNPTGRVFGWANSEYEIFKQASQARQQVVASNHNQSSSATAKWKVPIAAQKFHPGGNIATQQGKHYVAFVMSDGDNATWLTNGMGQSASWLGNSHRGQFNMNWDFTPSLADMNPVAHNWFYEKAADGTGAGGGRDTFVTAMGLGTTYPSSYPLEDINGLAQNMWAAMAKADHRVMSILDNTFDTTRLDPILAGDQVLGMMYKTNSAAYKGRAGRVTFRNGKPIVSVRYSLWDKMVKDENGNWVAHADGMSSVDIINALKGTSTTFNPIDENSSGLSYSYSIINVHPWSVQFADGSIDTDPSDGTQVGNPMDNVWAIVQGLQSDGRFEIVGLEEMMIHLRNHFGTPVEGAVINATWIRDANSNWGTTRTNWTGALPNFVDATVNFGSGYITANRTISVTAAMKAGTINFNNATYSYTIGGTSSITLDRTSGSVAINVAAGSHSITAPLSLADNTVVTVAPAGSTLTLGNLLPTAVSLTKAGAGTLSINTLRAGALNVNGGTVRLTAGVSKVNDLAIANGATLDVRNNRLVVSGKTLGEVLDLIDAKKLITTSTTTSAYTTLGIASNADLHKSAFGDVSLGTNDVLAMYTYAGDADLSGGIDADDFFQIDQGYGSHRSLSGYYYGDFNHNGTIDADDYFLISANYSRNLTPFSTGAVAAVPEPAATISLVFSTLLLSGRRYNRACP